MINVTPDHPIAHEAYEQVKNLRCVLRQHHCHIHLKSLKQSRGFFIAGIYPNLGEGGFNRLDWLTEFEQLNGISNA